MKLNQVMLVIFAFSLNIIACDQQKDGGGCTYDTDTVPATLIKLVAINETSYDALFEVEYNGRKDSFSYAAKNNQHYIFTKEIPKESLVPGEKYLYINQKIITGTCTPELDLIILKPFALTQQ